MNSYSLTHLADGTLLRNLATQVARDRATTAALLAHLAEVDERQLYRAAAYESMFQYCVHELRMSEETTFRRIRVARTARQFPAIFSLLADGRLNLTAVLLLTPHLSPQTADELLAAAAQKTKPEIELLLAERFPRPDVPTLVQTIAAPNASNALAARPVVPSSASSLLAPMEPLALEPVVPSSELNLPVGVEPLSPRARLAPLSPGRYALQVTVDQETHEQLRYVQTLLGHALPSGDIAQVLKRALNSLARELERQKFAKAARSRPSRGPGNGRYIPAEIRRKVWERDGGQCTFVSEGGKRCEARARLEYDHVNPLARGGETSVDGSRLMCRAHNQLAAECTYGAGCMSEKRKGRRRQAAAARLAKKAKADAKTQARAEAEALARAEAEAASERDLVPWLRTLGFSLQEARHGAELCAHMPDTPLEERMKVALRGLAPRGVRRPVYVGASPSGEQYPDQAAPLPYCPSVQ